MRIDRSKGTPTEQVPKSFVNVLATGDEQAPASFPLQEWCIRPPEAVVTLPVRGMCVVRGVVCCGWLCLAGDMPRKKSGEAGLAAESTVSTAEMTQCVGVSVEWSITGGPAESSVYQDGEELLSGRDGEGEEREVKSRPEGQGPISRSKKKSVGGADGGSGGTYFGKTGTSVQVQVAIF
ncbi:hypothetical protein NPX13_g3344 [Xylaria arbuscula]|uniref:Uncharacterized protein n=1 Tax=Xylaria arbuscula TaxID=114810 RepID=A0A9W8TPF2_9PEZI|nr:hypothetical protein NPX13_g3344 [Xylaria arbuscula]